MPAICVGGGLQRTRACGRRRVLPADTPQDAVTASRERQKWGGLEVFIMGDDSYFGFRAV